MRIKDLPLAGSVSDGDYLATDNAVDGTQKTTKGDLLADVYGYATLRLTTPTFSSLPVTFYHSEIKSNMVVSRAIWSKPRVQFDKWSVKTANGSVTISGTISGSTYGVLFLTIPRNDVTATTTP